MRRKSREISIFGVSTLDIFASAMGVFMLIAVVLFPYYMKNSRALELRDEALAEAEAQAAEAERQERRAEAAEQETEQQRERAEAAEEETEQERERAEAAEEELKETHLQVAITWEWGDGIESEDDIDLYLVDPSGNVFKHDQRTHPGVPGKLLVDTLHTPGGEIWSAARADPGVYTACIARHRFDRSADLTVEGVVAHRDGRDALPDVEIGSSVTAATRAMAAVKVHQDGEVSVHQVRQESLLRDECPAAPDQLLPIEIKGLEATGQCTCFQRGPGKHN
ncbi:hypothetical protein [Halorhodospira sp. 9622]|uniref:hypothetical protein n=1 Tax=Halorhodospira sp. 9622 TaxID=2899136 RepID=UPI001EE902D7|nr:hypothetical protein [Halorhodospira sp. 9622]MCG5539352.1 hypothetical protein [Halorhodospira sp. 9622]